MPWTMSSVGTARGVIRSIKRQAAPVLFPPIEHENNRQKAAVAELIITEVSKYKRSRFHNGVSVFAIGHADSELRSLEIKISPTRIDV